MGRENWVASVGMTGEGPNGTGNPKTQAPNPSLGHPSCFCQSRKGFNRVVPFFRVLQVRKSSTGHLPRAWKERSLHFATQPSHRK
jgi:hypothetical protein